MVKAGNFYDEAKKLVGDDEIAHHGSDLYLKKTAETTKLVEDYEFRNLVTTFTDQITKTPWYDIPFVYPGRDI